MRHAAVLPRMRIARSCLLASRSPGVFGLGLFLLACEFAAGHCNTPHLCWAWPAALGVAPRDAWLESGQRGRQAAASPPQPPARAPPRTAPPAPASRAPGTAGVYMLQALSHLPAPRVPY